jgi:heme exporter protein A
MSQNVILENKSLTLTVGYKTLFRNRVLSFSDRGTVLIKGENGSGKSTLLREIYLNSSETTNWIWPHGKKSIGFLGHDLGLYTSLTLSENLDYFSSLSLHAKTSIDIKGLLDFYQLTRRKNDPIYTYSRGMKQKAAIIRCLVSSPEILLLDEPYTGLDIKSMDLFTQHLNQEREKRLIIIVLHQIPASLKIDQTFSLEGDAD